MRDDLTTITETVAGARFFKQFLKDSGVTRSRFSHDPYEITAAEATRRLAMSYLHLLGQDDPQVSLVQPSAESREGKQSFEDDHLNRWFKRPKS